jgi:hypothetical protein
MVGAGRYAQQWRNKQIHNNQKLLIKFGTLSIQPEIVVHVEHGHGRVFRMDMRMGPIPGSTCFPHTGSCRSQCPSLRTDILIDSGIRNIPRLCTSTNQIPNIYRICRRCDVLWTFQRFFWFYDGADDLSTTNDQDNFPWIHSRNVMYYMHQKEKRTALNYLSVVMSSIDLHQIHKMDEVSNKTLPINKMMHFACLGRLHVNTILT